MKDSPTTIPAELQADHIAATLRNSNELMARMFAVQNLDGVLRTEKPRQHSGQNLSYVDHVIYLPSGGRVFGGGYGV